MCLWSAVKWVRSVCFEIGWASHQNVPANATYTDNSVFMIAVSRQTFARLKLFLRHDCRSDLKDAFFCFKLKRRRNGSVSFDLSMVISVSERRHIVLWLGRFSNENSCSFSAHIMFFNWSYVVSLIRILHYQWYVFELMSFFFVDRFFFSLISIYLLFKQKFIDCIQNDEDDFFSSSPSSNICPLSASLNLFDRIFHLRNY